MIVYRQFSHFFSLACIACIAIASTAGTVIDRAVSFVTELISCLARPFFELMSDHEPMPFRSTLSYAGPTNHYLRHEAGMSRRSAARHV
jgi:hypothetical protein